MGPPCLREDGRLDGDLKCGAATQLLHRPTTGMDPAEIAGSIAGAQAQDVYAGPLTFRSRSRKLTAAEKA